MELFDIVSLFQLPLDDIRYIENSNLPQNIKLIQLVEEVFEAMAKAYIMFRKWQKKINKVNKRYHSNFHGSRDIYAAYKFVSAMIKGIIVSVTKC